MIDNEATLKALHTGGIVKVASFDKSFLAEVLERLTSCHDHVFVVDQSHGDRIAVGVSEAGLACIMEELA